MAETTLVKTRTNFSQMKRQSQSLTGGAQNKRGFKFAAWDEKDAMVMSWSLELY